MRQEIKKTKKSNPKYEHITPEVKVVNPLSGEMVSKREYPFGEYEYKKRFRDEGNEWKEFPEEDKEVFEKIDPDVVAEERENRQIYVYLTMSIYDRIRYAAKMRMSDTAIRAYANLYGGKFKKLLRKYPLLRDRINTWRDELLAKATENVARNIIEKGDVDNSKWVLERLDRENFGKKTEVNVSGEVGHKHTLDMEQLKELRGDLQKALTSDNDDKDVIEVE